MVAPSCVEGFHILSVPYLSRDHSKYSVTFFQTCRAIFEPSDLPSRASDELASVAGYCQSLGQRISTEKTGCLVLSDLRVSFALFVCWYFALCYPSIAYFISLLSIIGTFVPLHSTVQATPAEPRLATVGFAGDG